MRRRLFTGGALAAAAVVVGILAGTAGTAPPAGFDTDRAPMLAPLEAGVVIDPILSTGDVIGGYQMSGIPDGIGAYLQGAGDDDEWEGEDDDGRRVLQTLMNHELEPGAAPGVYSRISKLAIDPKTRRVLDASYAFTGLEGFARFCSSSLEVLNGTPLYFTGEEDIPTSGRDGSSIAMNARTGDWVETPHFGHLLHENVVPVKRLSKAFFLTTDDDFREPTAQSPYIAAYLYAYIAKSWKGAIKGTQGSLYVWKADEGDSSNDIAKGETLEGRFVPITQAENANGDTLERASDAKGAFKFVRLEDAAVAKSGRGHVYFVDTGRLNAATSPPSESVRGRMYRLDIDPRHPTRAKLRLLLDGDAGDNLVNPDNIDTSRRSVVINEDRNSEHRGAEVAGGFGRILVYDIRSGAVRAVAYAATPPPLRPGTWESSGILNAEKWLGNDWWLVDVQAHSTTAPQPGRDLEPVDFPNGEDGQLLAIKIPRS